MFGRRVSLAETVPYWLATTAIEFVGTVTTNVPAHGGPPPPPAVSAQATPIVRADQKCPRRELSLDPSKFASEKMTLKFTEDGRLSSSEGNSVGVGPVIVSSLATLAGTAATAAIHVAGAHLLLADETLAASTPPVDPFPDQGLLDDTIEAQRSVGARLATFDPAATGADEEIKVISDLLDALASERTRLEAAKLAWSAPGKTTIQSFSYILDARELPTADQLSPAPGTTLTGTVADVWHNLHIMATIELAAEASRNPSNPSPNVQSIFFRRPQAATLKVWSRVDGGETWTAVPVSSAPIDLLDERSPHESLQVSQGHLFSNEDIAITFGENGTPATITSDEQHGLSALLTALSGVTKDFTGGVTAASDLTGAWQKAVPSASSRQIAALTEEKERLSLLADIKALQSPAKTAPTA
jgi:hypothetical protein